MNTENTDIKQINPFSNIDIDLKRLDEIQKINSLRAGGDCDNMLPVVDILIPDSVIIDCPMARGMLQQAKGCPSCKNFNGIVQTGFNDEYEMQWDHKFAVSCGFPVDRKCASMSLFEG